MKIQNRVKNIIRFKTTIGSVTLMPGMNELSKEEFVAVKAHPMFEAMVKTSGLTAIEEKPAKSYKTKAELKSEKEAEEKAEKESSDSEEGVDLNEIDLEAQNKATLIDLAQSLEIETDGLTKAQLIEAINSKK